MTIAGREPFPTIYVDSKEEGKVEPQDCSLLPCYSCILEMGRSVLESAEKEQETIFGSPEETGKEQREAGWTREEVVSDVTMSLNRKKM